MRHTYFYKLLSLHFIRRALPPQAPCPPATQREWPKRRQKLPQIRMNQFKFQFAHKIEFRSRHTVSTPPTMDTFLKSNAIGSHISKRNTLANTIQSIPDFKRPYQIFLGNPQSSKVAIAAPELAVAAEAVKTTGAQVFVHAPYIVNLSAANDWNRPLLQKNLQYAAASGFKGVVVHVGKSTSQPVPAAIQTMREAIAAVLPAATAACPLLLETPAGQGTELLTTPSAFIEFVSSFGDDPRLRVCMDTCHVFAAGHDPLAYLNKLQEATGLLKLIHFNDSQECCGSCKDRHALVGTGHIGFEKMSQIAAVATAAGIPMVIE